MLTLDGSTLEGGGQLTRMALCLSAITGIPIKIHSIRAGRGPVSLRSSSRGGHNKRTGKGDRKGNASAAAAGGGLKESHLAALYWLAEQCRADVEGDQVGSREVVFEPDKRLYARKVTSDVDSSSCVETTIELQRPGSVWLIFQAIFPWMVFGPRSYCRHHGRTLDGEVGEKENLEPELPMYDVTFKGGTNVPKSMSTEYVQQVFLPVCEKIGLPRVEVQTISRGWTTGRLQIGEVRVKVYRPLVRGDHAQPKEATTSTTTPTCPHSFTLPAVNLTSRGDIISVDITLLTSSLETHTILSELLITLLTRHLFSSISSQEQTQEGQQPKIRIHPSSSHDSGDPRRLYVLLVVHTSNGWILGRDFLGSGGAGSGDYKNSNNNKKPSSKQTTHQTMILEQIATRVTSDLLVELQRGSSCVDEFMADQLVVFQALANRSWGRVDAGFESNFDPRNDGNDGNDDDEREKKEEKEKDSSGSLHARTVRWIAEEILGRYGVEFQTGGWCRGVGWGCREREGREGG